MTGPASDNPYRVPLEQLDQERVARTDQVVLRGDGMGPPVFDVGHLHADGHPHDDGDGD